MQQMMRPMRDQITPGLVFQGLPMAFNAEAAKGVDATYRFDITGEGGGTWTVKVARRRVRDRRRTADEADWRFELDADTWIGMTTGDFLGQEAFMLGHVTIEGDPIIGMAFDQFFTPPRRERQARLGRRDVSRRVGPSERRCRVRSSSLAHGAGGDLNDALLARVARELAAAASPSLRFNFPYREAGRKAPGAQAQSESCYRAVADRGSRAKACRCSAAASRTADGWRRTSSPTASTWTDSCCSAIRFTRRAVPRRLRDAHLARHRSRRCSSSRGRRIRSRRRSCLRQTIASLPNATHVPRSRAAITRCASRDASAADVVDEIVDADRRVHRANAR